MDFTDQTPGTFIPSEPPQYRPRVPVGLQVVHYLMRRLPHWNNKVLSTMLKATTVKERQVPLMIVKYHRSLGQLSSHLGILKHVWPYLPMINPCWNVAAISYHYSPSSWITLMKSWPRPLPTAPYLHHKTVSHCYSHRTMIGVSQLVLLQIVAVQYPLRSTIIDHCSISMNPSLVLLMLFCSGPCSLHVEVVCKSIVGTLPSSHV